MGCFDIVNLMAEGTAILPPKDYEPERPNKIGVDMWEDQNGRVYKYSEVTRDILLVHDPEANSRIYTIENMIRQFKPEVRHCLQKTLPPESCSLMTSWVYY